MAKQQALANELEEFSAFLKLDGQPNRAIGYEKAARNIRTARYMPPDPSDIDGVGESIRTTIARWQRSGDIQELEELREEYPWFDTLNCVKYVGPERARKIHEKLSVDTIDDLLLVGQDLTLVNGIGPKTARKILDSAREQSENRHTA